MTVGLKFSLLISIRGCEQHIKMPYMYMFSKKEYLSLMDKSTNKIKKNIQKQQPADMCGVGAPSNTECLCTQSSTLFPVSPTE